MAYPDDRVLPIMAVETGSNPNFINGGAKIASHIVLDGRCIARLKPPSRAPIPLQIEHDEVMYVGQVTDLFTHTTSHSQPQINKALTFLRVLWFRRFTTLDTVSIVSALLACPIPA